MSPFAATAAAAACAQVPTALVRELAPRDDLAKFEEFTLRSFVEDNRKLSWCADFGVWGGFQGSTWGVA